MKTKIENPTFCIFDSPIQIFLLLMLVIIPVLSHGKTIHVSTTGNDNNPGTINNPVLSLRKAQQLARQNAGKSAVNIILDDGTYYLSEPLVFKKEDSGTKNNPVIWQAANEGKAVISGGKLLQLSWEPFRDGIYQTKVDTNIMIDQLYINGQRQRMARFPNAEEGKNVFDSWELIHTREPDPNKDPLDPLGVASWANPEGAYIHAMHTALWGDMHWRIAGRNDDGSLQLEGGWQNNRPTPMHPRYRMVENVFEELDVPGEWFFNQKEGVLYYFPLPGAEISSAKVEIVILKHLIEFQGTKLQPVQFVHLEGLVFKHAARTFMENREPLLRSDWTVYRGGAIFFNGAEDCVVSNCEFDQLGGNSIFVNNYNRRLTFSSCYIHHGGANGIAFVGDPKMVRSPIFRYGAQDFEIIDRTSGPKGDNYPADCVVEDCLITMTGRDEKQTSPVQISMSHKITVRHSSIYDVPRAGINISEGTFGGHLIEYCDVFNTVLETGDHGSFNSWGRDRFWTPNILETAIEIENSPELYKLDMLHPNIIRNSRWRCDHGWDIDLDDGSSWYLIYNNVLLNGGLKMREGYNRRATNNIIINNSLHPHVWYPKSGDVFKHNIVFGAYRPAVMHRGLAPNDKWGKELDYNLFATNREDIEKFMVNGCDSNSAVGDPLFVNPTEGDFRVNENSSALKIGFQNFPMDQFGVVSEKLKKIAKTPLIPQLIASTFATTGKIYKWLGGEVKNIETRGEQSASGLSSMSGVLVLSAPDGSVLAKKGFIKSDVIVRSNGEDIISFDHLLNLLEDSNKMFDISVMRDQQERIFYVEFQYAALIAFTSGSASADFIVKKVSDSRVDSKALTIAGRYGQSINGQSFQQDALVTRGDYQYVGYYDASRRVCIARRKLPLGKWDIIRFEDYRFESNDAHNTISIGICPNDGTIHMAFDHHVHTLRYRVSRQGVANEPETVTWAASLFGPITSEMGDDVTISRLTYPRFWQTPDGGLQFCYRRGGSGNGDRIMLDYDPQTGMWMNDRQVDSGEGEFNHVGITTGSRCSYPNGYEYGPKGKLHVTWVWREARPSPGGNHSILYAYSEDGGNTWLNNAGQALDGPPNINSPGLTVVDIPWKYGLMNTQAQAVDSKDRIHAVMWHMTDASIKSAKAEPNPVWGAEDARRYHHYWRDQTGVWQHHELPGIAGNRPKLFFDSEDNAYLIFGRKATADPTDWGIYFTDADLVIMAATAKSGWTDWRVIHVEEGPFMNEMLGDVHRWKNKGVLSVMVQQSPAKPHDATTLRVLDFTIEKIDGR